MPVDAVVFDIGNVLVEWNPERVFDAKIGKDRRKALFEAVDLFRMNDAVDRGGDLATVVQDTARRHPDWADDILIWRDHWIEMVGPAIDASVEILRDLRRQGTPVFALTNYGAATFERSIQKFPFYEEFDRTYVSGRMGVVKPDAEIYRRMEEDCGVAPSGLLFTDDRPENIAAATSRGWQGHVFDGADGFRKRLVAEGVL